MRGHIRIRSERTPYRRAGLAFGEDRILEVPAVELSGERLLTLLGDPALRVEFWDGERYQGLAGVEGLVPLVDAAAAQQFLDLVAKDLMPGAGKEPPSDDAGLQLATARDRIAQLERELEDANGEGDELAKAAGALADFLEEREGFERQEGETPGAAAIRVILGLDAELEKAASLGAVEEGSTEASDTDTAEEVEKSKGSAKPAGGAGGAQKSPAPRKQAGKR